VFCNKCGRKLNQDALNCEGCGNPSGSQHTSLALERAHFDRIIRTLGHLWYAFAALSVTLAIIGLFMVQTGLMNSAGPWEPWPHPPVWSKILAGSGGWALAFSRIVLGAAAGWGLIHRTDWCRVVAILASAIALTQFPMGAVLGVFTLIMTIGRHRIELYNHPV